VLKLGNNTIAGIVMEKANGTNVVKSLKREGFCNVSWSAGCQNVYAMSIVYLLGLPALTGASACLCIVLLASVMQLHGQVPQARQLLQRELHPALQDVTSCM
jgi:hypothetical protein